MEPAVRNRTSARSDAPEVRLRAPDAGDGAAFWRMAESSGTLDLNSPYAYLLWCAQFAETSVVAEVDGAPAGFVMGFRPPGRAHVLFVWQVAVEREHRGLGLAGRMLDHLLERPFGLTAVEATVTPSNEASQRLFRALARRHRTECREEPYLSADHFPAAGHEPENLFHIGPIQHGSDQPGPGRSGTGQPHTEQPHSEQ